MTSDIQKARAVLRAVEAAKIAKPSASLLDIIEDSASDLVELTGCSFDEAAETVVRNIKEQTDAT